MAVESGSDEEEDAVRSKTPELDEEKLKTFDPRKQAFMSIIKPEKD